MSCNAKPRITIVTPNYNCGSHLEQTIQSVISQNYPNLQYIVIDGGSTDNSVEIIKKYEQHIDFWVSEPDGGAAEAIKKGFGVANGEWMNWLNSDDYLLPDALNILAEVIHASPNAKWITGTRIIVNERGGGLRHCGTWYNRNLNHLIRDVWYAQECTFFRKSFYVDVGGVDAKIRSVFDNELYQRMIRVEFPVFTTAVLGVFRNRLGQLSKNQEELAKDYAILTKYFETQNIYVRFIYRIARTRFKPLITAIVDPFFRFGILPLSRRLKVVLFDETLSQWIEVPYYKSGLL